EKTTSPWERAGAPNGLPSKTVPSSRTRRAFVTSGLVLSQSVRVVHAGALAGREPVSRSIRSRHSTFLLRAYHRIHRCGAESPSKERPTGISLAFHHGYRVRSFGTNPRFHPTETAPDRPLGYRRHPTLDPDICVLLEAPLVGARIAFVCTIPDYLDLSPLNGA